MSTTITVRTDRALRKALEERAHVEGKTVSELVREILAGVLAPRSFGERVGHLRGRLTVRSDDLTGWRKLLRERNWRP